MFSNTITLNDGTNDHLFDLVSRQGMKSDRREQSVASQAASVLTLQNTIDLNNQAATNRHFIRFGWNDIDATTGELYPGSVHAVVQRHKLVDDANIIIKCALLSAFLGSSTNVSEMLVGGN